MKKWFNPDAAAVVAITLVIFLFFFRLLTPAPQLIITPDFGQSDAVASFSTKYFLGTQLVQHRIPLWTSLIGGGYPLYAHGSMGTFFLPNLIFFSLISPVYAYTIVLFLSVCFLGWGMYWWLRLLGYSRLSSVFGAVTLALGGYSIAQFTHITIVQSLSLFPAIAGCTHLLAIKKSWQTTGWLSLLLAQQILVGFPQSVFITVLFILAYYGWLVGRSNTKIHDAIRFIVSLLAAFGVSAIQILPSYEYLSTVVSGAGFSVDSATLFSYPIKHLLTLFHPFWLGNPATGTYPHFLAFAGSIFWENTGYIGVVPLIFLAIYLLLRTAKKSASTPQGSVVFFVLLLSASFLLMTGKYSPLYFVFSVWPFTLFRVPSRFIWLFDIALVVLCVHAFDVCIASFKQKRLASLIALFAIALQVLTIFFIWSPYHNLEPAHAWLEPPTLSQYVASDGYTITIGGERTYGNTYQSRGWSVADPTYRPSYILRNTFTPDKNMLWGIAQIRDYAGRNIRRSKVLEDLLDQTITTDQTYATISALGSKLLTILSVKTVISALSLTQTGLVSKASLTDATHMIDLYTNPDALPKVYIATSSIPVTTIDEAVRAFASDAFIPGKTVLVEDGKSFSSDPERASVHIDSAGQGSYTLRVTNEGQQALVVLTETYYPGWRARIDTKETKVFPVNVKHIGVFIPKGDHTVTIYYLPDSFTRGAWISLISATLITLLIVFSRFLAI